MTAHAPTPQFVPQDEALLQVADVQTARALVAWRMGQAEAAGLALRPPPPEPTTCCGRGCNGCVWEGFYEALFHWREDARALLGETG
jgi:hypothetical protein